MSPCLSRRCGELLKWKTWRHIVVAPAHVSREADKVFKY